MAKQHAIVIGGSMAGLCAARVLSGFYEKVTVIDRDAYPAGAHERPGVPQSRHVHALLARSDIVSLHLPLTPETTRTIGELSAGQIWGRYVRYIGAGAVAAVAERRHWRDAYARFPGEPRAA